MSDKKKTPPWNPLTPLTNWRGVPCAEKETESRKKPCPSKHQQNFPSNWLYSDKINHVEALLRRTLESKTCPSPIPPKKKQIRVSEVKVVLEPSPLFLVHLYHQRVFLKGRCFVHMLCSSLFTLLGSFCVTSAKGSLGWKPRSLDAWRAESWNDWINTWERINTEVFLLTHPATNDHKLTARPWNYQLGPENWCSWVSRSFPKLGNAHSFWACYQL